MIDWLLFGKLCGGALPLLFVLAVVLHLLITNNNTMANRLYRSQSDKKIAGVCGGIAEYFNIDPTIVRLLWLILVFCFGGGLVAYLLAVIVIPYRPVQGGDYDPVKSRFLRIVKNKEGLLLRTLLWFDGDKQTFTPMTMTSAREVEEDKKLVERNARNERMSGAKRR